jgi:CBS domain-containing protein
MAVLDPVAYLRETAPFDRLPAPAFDEAARAMEIVFHTRGTRLVSRGGEPLEHLYVIRKGAVRLEREAATIQLLEEGEIFGFTSLITGRATLDVIADDDLLAYRIPRPVFERLLADASFAGHFATGLGERLRSFLDRPQAASFQADLSMPLGKLVHSAPVWVEAAATAADAARAMDAHGVSAVLVRSEPAGIVTDRDFRTRVLAQGLGPETPVARICTQPLRTVNEDMPVYEAWHHVLDPSGVRHLAVARGAEVVGLLTSIDLLKQTSQGPVAVLRSVERLASREALPGYAARVTEMSAALLAGGLDPFVIAGFVARLNDTLIARILRWAEAELGPPPVPYAWMVFGSEGRMEQTLLTDQDNALVSAEETPEGEEYFAEMAERAVRDLVAAGFPPCPGDCMATRWRGSLDWWRRQFREWAEEPKPQALLHASIFFDFRAVHGHLDLAPLVEEVARAARSDTFRNAMARVALGFKPPPSLLLRIRGESSSLDIKAHGVTPVVGLARVYGLEVGSRSRATLDRLQDAVRVGVMGRDELATISEAYHFIVQLRLRQQLRMAAEGEEVSNVISLARLSSIERTRLKDAFGAIARWQERAAFHFHVY